MLLTVAVACCALTAQAESKFGLQVGSPNLKSAGALAFGPAGILFVADAKQAIVFALDTQDTKGDPSGADFKIEGLNKAVADLLGTTSRDILINDLAVNPSSGNLYLSVSRGRGPAATPVILRISAANKISEVSLKKIGYSQASIPNPPEDAETGQGRRRRNKRTQSITDLGFIDGQLFVAGLSNEEFASKLTAIPFPFKKAAGGTSVEIFHGAHGGFETRSPVRTFTSYKIGNENHLLAAYTCTPLVKFKISDLKAGKKLKGTTIAELGNRNNPLDMFVYKQGGKDYLLIANTSRGVMKVSTDAIGEIEGITNRISGTAGLKYETIEALKGVTQLDRLNESHAVALIVDEAGSANLTTIALP
jgi:hypothetical protein